jgi:hypothetical protein
VAAWAEWAGKIKGDHVGWEEMHKNEQTWASLPAPDRMEKMRAFSKGHIAKQELGLAATKTFYATLTPEQRKSSTKVSILSIAAVLARVGSNNRTAQGSVSLCAKRYEQPGCLNCPCHRN